jgi:large subunit ribosomal protein L20
MPRVKRGVTARARHKKVIDAAKGYRGRRKNVFGVELDRKVLSDMAINDKPAFAALVARIKTVVAA